MRPYITQFPLLVLLCVLLLPSALANPVYWTVVADDGTAADVVSAANFAASMKASADVSFSGKTESQVADADQDPADLLTVHLQGDTAEIVYGTNPAFEQIADLAARYLRDQGFTVTTSEGVDTAAPVREPPRVLPVPVKNTPAVLTTVNQTAPIAQPPDDREQTINNVAPEPTSNMTLETEPTPVVDQETGPFTRFWRWLVALFS